MRQPENLAKPKAAWKTKPFNVEPNGFVLNELAFRLPNASQIFNAAATLPYVQPNAAFFFRKKACTCPTAHEVRLVRTRRKKDAAFGKFGAAKPARWGRLSFAYFSLAKQRKVSAPSAWDAWLKLIGCLPQSANHFQAALDIYQVSGCSSCNFTKQNPIVSAKFIRHCAFFALSLSPIYTTICYKNKTLQSNTPHNTHLNLVNQV